MHGLMHSYPRHPPHERELTAFTALDGVDPILEPEDYLEYAVAGDDAKN